MVNYREKYLKYKLKYLNLKNKKSIGGARLYGAGKYEQDQEEAKKADDERTRQTNKEGTDNTQINKAGTDNTQTNKAGTDDEETIKDYTKNKMDNSDILKNIKKPEIKGEKANQGDEEGEEDNTTKAPEDKDKFNNFIKKVKETEETTDKINEDEKEYIDDYLEKLEGQLKEKLEKSETNDTKHQRQIEIALYHSYETYKEENERRDTIIMQAAKYIIDKYINYNL
tara:strand:+ start:72 stop:749 length:678 start_codon:yes stop_codon:yes gene_type:complete